MNLNDSKFRMYNKNGADTFTLHANEGNACSRTHIENCPTSQTK